MKNEYVVLTDDGLSIEFRSDGLIKKISLDNEEYKLKENEKPQEEILGKDSGVFVEDVNKRETARVLGELKARKDGVYLWASLGSLGLALNAKCLSKGGYLTVDGELVSTVYEPRSVNLYFKLPVIAKDWIWWDDIESRREIEERGTYETEIYPFACINHGKAGISMAIPPNKPCIFKLGYNPVALFHACFRFGLHPQSKLGSKAPFHLIIYRNDPKWGFRHTAKRYYTFFDSYFKRRALKDGLWLLSHDPLYPPLDQFPDLSDYIAYHETHYPMHGPKDEELGIGAFEYIIPGQREVNYLSSVPSTYGECMKPLEETSQDEILDVDGVTITRYGRGKGKESRKRKVEIIKNSVLYDDKGRYVHKVSAGSMEERGNRVKFVMNPDPDLYSDENKPTQGRAMIDFCREFLQRNPSFQGIYVDSLAGWGVFYNHRVEHFKYADIPLTYNPSNEGVAIKNKFSHIELLRVLRKVLHKQGRLLFGNGVRPGRFFNGALLDILGVEQCGHDLARYRIYRTFAYQKPFLILCHKLEQEKKIENYIKRCALYGLFPGSHNYEDLLKRGKSHLDLFLPLLKRISAAGWEPVTYAFSSDKEIILERFGKDNSGDFYLTVYNPTETDKEISLKVQTKELGIKKIKRVKELVEGKEMQPSPKIKLSVPKLSLRIIQVSRGSP